ncbi:MAG: FHA domain-containing protein [Anaerolineales bacterium]
METRRKILFLLLALLLAGMAGAPAGAQTGLRVELESLSAGSFPTISADFRLYDAAGNAVAGLEAEAVRALEDGVPRPLEALVELQPGVQFVVALNPGPGTAARDQRGVSRQQLVLEALTAWAATLPADNPDDLSFLTTDGVDAVHLGGDAFRQALSAYTADPRSLTPSLTVLSRALDVAAEPTPRPAMKRVVLFISSIPEAAEIPVLQNLTARARDLGIYVNVWIVASRDYFTTSGATALKDLAIRTGGQYATFSGQEALPEVETYLLPYRSLYRLTYTSVINTSGAHELAVQVTLAGETAVSAAQTFDIQVRPPNPILVLPPEQITRQLPDPTSNDLTAFLPAEQIIQMIVEFPDGHPRPLVRTALYVDGVLADENTSEPFDVFVWDLRAYTSGGEHILTVEAVDSLGLSQTSLGMPVRVSVVQPRRGLGAFLARHAGWVTGIAALLAGSLLIVVLASSGRRRRRVAAARRGRASKLDPLTQPVPRLDAGRASFLTRSRRVAPAAYLVRLRLDGQPVTAPPVPITETELTFGTDPTRANRLLDDPSVAPLHATLWRDEAGEFYLRDEKSVAGTWVNYQPLGGEARRLQHGDILHIGQVSYRFMLSKPPERPAPRLIRPPS